MTTWQKYLTVRDELVFHYPDAEPIDAEVRRLLPDARAEGADAALAADSIDLPWSPGPAEAAVNAQIDRLATLTPRRLSVAYSDAVTGLLTDAALAVI